MESQYKTDTNGREVVVANKRKMRGSDLVLRFFALALCLAAAVILGVDRQTTTIPVTLVPTLPPVNVPIHAKWHYLSAFVFFVVANAIACAYAAISLLLTLANMGKKKSISMMMVTFDLVMVALLFSSVGAAVSIGLMGHEGNSHLRWGKVCDRFGKFCHQAAAAMALSGVGAVLFFLLVVLAIVNLHKRH